MPTGPRPEYAPGTFIVPDQDMVHYRDGKLIQFRRHSVTVTTVDAHGPRSWVKTASCPRFLGTELPEEFPFGIHEYVRSLDGDKPIEELPYIRRQFATFYRDRVPAEVCRTVAPYFGDAWAVASLCMRTRGLELAQSHPALAVLVARNRHFLGWTQQPWERARRLVGRRRREILGQAGFPETESAVKVLAKVPAQVACMSNLWSLRQVMSGDDAALVDSLRHLPALDWRVFEALRHERLRCLRTPAMLALFATMDERTSAHRLLKDTGEMLHMVQMREGVRVQSLAALRRLHDRLALAQRGLIGTGPFPRPPFPDAHLPGGLSVEYLRSPEMLHQWSKVQGNCAWSYESRIRSRTKCRLYRVISPEEATLSLVPGEHGHWEIDALLAAGNRPVRPATAELVRWWLRAARIANGQEEVACPFPGCQRQDFEVAPVGDWEKNAFWERMRLLDLAPGNTPLPRGYGAKSCFFWMSRPEPALLVLAPVNGHWEVVMARRQDGVGDLSAAAHDRVESWLWQHARPGAWCQMSLAFGEGEL